MQRRIQPSRGVRAYGAKHCGSDHAEQFIKGMGGGVWRSGAYRLTQAYDGVASCVLAIGLRVQVAKIIHRSLAHTHFTRPPCNVNVYTRT
jgi:hypothetical protein